MSPVAGRDAAVAVQDTAADADDLTLAAEAAEAEAVAAEARAEAARARAHAARLRRAAATERRTADAPEPDSTPPEADEPELAAASSDDAAESAQSGATAVAPAAAAPARKRTLRATGTRLRTALAEHPRRTAVRTLAVLIIAAALATSGVLVHQHREAAALERSEAEFAAAAKQGVIALTTLDFNHAAEDVQRVLDNSTGPFRDDFQGRSEDFTAVIEQSQVATEGTVNAVAVESMTEDSAVVLVSATSRVTNSGGAQQEPRAWRLSVTVRRDGDTMRMAKVEFVP